MRLTKLELQGFKSFADTTELVFNPGVTAIVMGSLWGTGTGLPAVLVAVLIGMTALSQAK